MKDKILPVVASLAVSAGIGDLCFRAAAKLNAKANADVRASFAQERIARALEKIASRQ